MTMYDRLTSEEKKLIRVAAQRPELKTKIAKYLKKSAKETVVLFLEVVLSESEKNKLTSWVSRQEDTPSNWAGWNIISHHMTVEFFGNKGRASSIPQTYADMIGEDVVLKVTGIAADDKAVAVLIEPPRSIKSLVKNEFPHITVAVNGVKPFYSNKLLEKASSNGTLITENISFTLNAKVGFYDGRSREDSFELPHELF